MRVAIVGSNFISIAVALRLAERGHQVTVFERNHKLWGGAWKLVDTLGWRNKEAAWHVILFNDEQVDCFIEFFKYFGYKSSIEQDDAVHGADSFFAPKHIIPVKGISHFIQDLNRRFLDTKNITLHIDKVTNILVDQDKLKLLTRGSDYAFDKVLFNSCIDLESITVESETIKLSNERRRATHLIARFDSSENFSAIPHLMHVDGVDSNYKFDLIGQLALERTSKGYASLIVMRLKRNQKSILESDLQKYLSLVEKQVIKLLRFHPNTKLTGHFIDYHVTSYRKDSEMSHVMSKIPDCIGWIPTQDLSRTIPHLINKIWHL